MTEQGEHHVHERLHGGWWGPTLAALFALVVVLGASATYLYPKWVRPYGHQLAFNRAMFGPAIAQPISFSHRLHVTDKQIDCAYCHSTAERSLNAGMPAVSKCLGCHEHLISFHPEIEKLRAYGRRDSELPWVRVTYAPDHVHFPHFRHLARKLACQQCHGEVETVDRLYQVTIYMGFCLDCHDRLNAPRDCTACHQ